MRPLHKTQTALRALDQVLEQAGDSLTNVERSALINAVFRAILNDPRSVAIWPVTERYKIRRAA